MIEGREEANLREPLEASESPPAGRSASESGNVGPTAPGRLLGLDLGSVRVGYALSDSRQILASPQGIIQRGATHAEDHLRIQALVEEFGVVAVIVGLPLSLSGGESLSSRGAKIEVGELIDLLEVPVRLVDERLSSVEVNTRREELRRLSNAARRGGRGGSAKSYGKKGAPKGPAVIDDLAAALILQSYIDRNMRATQR
jgi:putative Holliday junction resolvase